MKTIKVGLASCGISAGGDEVYAVFESLLQKNPNENIILAKTGCIGACFREVLVDIEDGNNKYTYANVTPEIAERIYTEHAVKDNVVKEHLLEEPLFFDTQHRVVLRNTGIINPEVIEDYIANDGYSSLKKVLTEMKPAEVIAEVKAAGLGGRGGAGFSTGLKWEFTARESSPEKYVICNADEGDPGAFMDRSLLEGDPHAVIEGLAIAAFAIGAKEGYIYVRAEYPLAIKRLTVALDQARGKGFLGENILNSGFSFDIRLKIGAGAFVCGEETALIASIEGKRGMPRIKPPYPAKQGVWNKPSVINNVETLANVPYIIQKGAQVFSGIGSENSKGTKVFALTGKVKKSGLIEVTMGMTLREIIFEIGGGIKNNKPFKAVQLGGPSGGCIPESLIDTKVDYKSLTATGAIMGSGGMVVMDEDTCMVDVAKYFMNFIREESCGKCTFCRIGTTRMHEILERITRGDGQESDIDELVELGQKIKEASLCGLGQSAPNPVLTTFKYFKEEYLEHIKHKKCRAKVCKPLLTYTIEKEKCTGCTLCARNCPVDAISGQKKELHVIDQQVCIKCGKCFTVCNFDAVHVE